MTPDSTTCWYFLRHQCLEKTDPKISAPISMLPVKLGEDGHEERLDWNKKKKPG